MNLFRNTLKTYCVATLLPCVVATMAFAQTVSPKPSAAPASSVTDLNHLIDNPTLITLHFKDAPLRTVMGELAKQAGIELKYFPQKTLDIENKTINIDIDRQPFWMAVRAVSKASKINLSISRIGNNHPWTYTRDVDLNSPFYVSQGPFLIVADSIAVHDNSTTTFPFGSKPVLEKHPFAEIFVRSYTDPKLSLDGFSYTIEPEQIVDEKGNSLIPKSYFPFSPSYQPDSFRTSAAALDLSHHSGKRIVVFKGNLRFLQVKKSSTWEVPDILNAKGATKTVLCEGVPVRFMINDITQIQDGYKIRVTLSTDHFPTSNESNPYLGSQLQFAMSRISQSMRLIDSTGNAFHIGSTSSGGDNDNFTVNISFFKNPDGTIPGDPAKLIIEVPTELTEIKVPFEFTNLPLPKVK